MAFGPPTSLSSRMADFRRLAELVQDSLLGLSAACLIPGFERCGVLPHRHSGHGASVSAPPYFGNSTFEAPSAPSVTKPLRQIGLVSEEGPAVIRRPHPAMPVLQIVSAEPLVGKTTVETICSTGMAGCGR